MGLMLNVEEQLSQVQVAPVWVNLFEQWVRRLFAGKGWQAEQVIVSCPVENRASRRTCCLANWSAMCHRCTMYSCTRNVGTRVGARHGTGDADFVGFAS